MGNLGSAFITYKKYREAFDNIYKSLILAKEIGSTSQVTAQYENLSDLYELSNIALPDSLNGKLLNPEQMRLRSKYYYKRYISCRVSVYNDENKNGITRIEMNFEFEKKEAKSKAEHDKEILLSEEKQKRQKVIIFIGIGVVLLVLIFTFYILRSLRITRKQKSIIEIQKKLVESQKHLVEEKQKEIIDSIQYARRIQSALITPENYISKVLSRLSKKA